MWIENYSKIIQTYFWPKLFILFKYYNFSITPLPNDLFLQNCIIQLSTKNPLRPEANDQYEEKMHKLNSMEWNGNYKHPAFDSQNYISINTTDQQHTGNLHKLWNRVIYTHMNGQYKVKLIQYQGWVPFVFLFYQQTNLQTWCSQEFFHWLSRMGPVPPHHTSQVKLLPILNVACKCPSNILFLPL